MIDRANKEDLKDILELQKLAFHKVAANENNFTIAPLTQTLTDIYEEYEKRHFLKYTENRNIIGSVRAHVDLNNICHIGRLIVHPNYQNRGIGSKLIKVMEEVFHTCEAYDIFTGENSSNTVYLYKKLGYIETDKKIIDRVSIVFLRKQN